MPRQSKKTARQARANRPRKTRAPVEAPEVQPDNGQVVETLEFAETPGMEIEREKRARGRKAHRPKAPSRASGNAKGKKRFSNPERGSRGKRELVAMEPEPEPVVTAEAAAALETEAEIPDATLRQQLMRELDELIGRVRSLHPGYSPPPFSPKALLDLLNESVDKLPPGMGLGILDKLRGTIGEDLFDVDTWKGMWYLLNNTLQYQGDILKRRMTGEYETDEWGYDREFYDAVRPFFEFMYKTYWRVQTTGMENIPAEGRALLVSNHSGQLPWDGAMLEMGILLEHPSARMARALYGTWFPTLPFVSDFFVKTGQVLATEDNGTRLLEQDHLVAVFPEGYKGAGKLFKERYRLQRFGRGGFVKMALRAQAPLIPISVVGAEETYVSLGKSDLMAKLTGFPYFPISPTFPWLGLIGFIPLPTKWYIDIGEPIPTDGYKPGSENNMVLVSQLTDQVRNVIQEMIYARLASRRSVFFS
jgi:1-acyl-sn-glycerol-3-phosphate acyltransferase